MTKLFVLFLMTLPCAAYAGGLNNGVPQVGAHYPVVTFEKSKNPQNIMIIYTRLDGACELRKDPVSPDLPELGFYWLMDREHYQALNSLESSVIRDRMRVELHQDPAEWKRSFWVNIADFNEVQHDLPGARMLVKARQDQKAGCAADGFMTLGPSDGNAVIRLETVYSEVAGFIIPKPVSVTLKGVNVATGARVSRTYKAR